MFTLTAAPEPAYDAITDGKWSADMPYTALHRNAVAEKYRGTGISDQLLEQVERLTREQGRRCVRADTHRKNKAMVELLRRHGYRYRGNVLVDEPGHDPRRVAYEKLLK